MAVNFKYWDECADPPDMEAMWMDPDVRAEWIGAGETKKSKVHLSRDPDGQPYLTQTEMKAVAGIIARRHFVSQIDSIFYFLLPRRLLPVGQNLRNSGFLPSQCARKLDVDASVDFHFVVWFLADVIIGSLIICQLNHVDMICAIADLESDRQPLATRYNKKRKEITMGIMQILPKTAEWLVRDLNYHTYEVEKDSKLLYKPFVNVYLGAAYLKWLSNYDQKKVFEVGPLLHGPSSPAPPASQKKGPVKTTWDSRASPEDMEMMWADPTVSKEWTKSGEKRGKVRFSHDTEIRPYLSRAELRGFAEIILAKHFRTKVVKPTILCAIAEIVSMRFLNGVGQRTGLMGIDYPTARWLYKDLGYKAYLVESVEDLTKPFVSMYFGAAYLAWLSEFEGRERTPQFVVQAYLEGPKNVNLQEAGPLWLKFEEALSRYEDFKKWASSHCRRINSSAFHASCSN
ncbi:hypothetical protein RJ639_000907 [Escallonia herrerae]|uniref:Transglycosylase SLT domain-containing protein n=1 Tax=Escallonia herrerae TaxID=1293975 RepID=A0AA88XHV7_9ASTE|nr:hypothetical protein RJ639_000907 [Escallonia herrerae]